ncbi:MAG: histidine phosphatase family protein [Candidatus Sungbacteria bacterium]|nr:histidine phosphatase family protein [bacterium]MDZ4260450.1 histidine phosphatase family protein [Candidatus Sungbacteria bacterium]
MKFILTLHGHTAWNLEGILQGQIDTELHEVGIANATEKGKRLQEYEEKITRIISSDLKRSIQTAGIINQFLHVPTQTDARLRECSYGWLEGINKSHAEMQRALKGRVWQYFYNEYDYREYGGENYSDVLERYRELLDDVKHRYGSDVILLVGHITGMSTLLHACGQKNVPMERDEIRCLEY